MKRVTICNCPCSSSCCFSASVIRNIGEFGAKPLLQTTEQLMQYMVLGIHFRSLKYTTAIRIRKNLSNFPFLTKRYKAYYKTGNTRTRNTGGRAKHPGTMVEQLNITRNTSGTPPVVRTMKPYKTKNNWSVFKRKSKTRNLNFQLKFETLFIADISYLFISLYLRLVYT